MVFVLKAGKLIEAIDILMTLEKQTRAVSSSLHVIIKQLVTYFTYCEPGVHNKATEYQDIFSIWILQVCRIVDTKEEEETLRSVAWELIPLFGPRAGEG